MNKKLLLIAPAVALCACGEHMPKSDWRSDCETYYSYNSRALSVCKKQAEEKHRLEMASRGDMYAVTTDPENATRKSETEMGRSPQGDGRSAE